MLKQELRKIYSIKRSEISENQKIQSNSEIKEKFINQISAETSCIHIYLPIDSKHEIDTWPIIHELWNRKITTAVPVIDKVKNILKTSHLTRETELKRNKWNIPEPRDCVDIMSSKIDMIVLPLLAYDTEGYRVGYGKGYYDMFLNSLDKNVAKIGLSYFAPVDKISDRDPWDVKLDICITAEKVFNF